MCPQVQIQFAVYIQVFAEYRIVQTLKLKELVEKLRDFIIC